MARKGAGKEAKALLREPVDIDNRHGLVVKTRLIQARGIAEPKPALAMAAEIPGWGWVTLGADPSIALLSFCATWNARFAMSSNATSLTLSSGDNSAASLLVIPLLRAARDSKRCHVCPKRV
jgi:hypothetical protein